MSVYIYYSHIYSHLYINSHSDVNMDHSLHTKLNGFNTLNTLNLSSQSVALLEPVTKNLMFCQYGIENFQVAGELSGLHEDEFR